MHQSDVLILADGIVAKHLIDRILEDSFTSNRYHIVYMDQELKPESFGDNFFFYNFDPTSFTKLSTLFTKSFKEVVIVLGNKIDTVASYQNVRTLDKNISIVLFDRWDLQIEDKNFIKIDANEILASRLFDYLPNVPVIAQNVGLGHGEIIEVLVPFGSGYVYRHVGTIEQKRWRIAAIYRNNKLILPSSNLMIWPNDLLLLIGEPEVLKQVFKSIKREVGQFPLPYGINSYLLVDMERNTKAQIRHILRESLYLHSKLKDRKLFIRILNPNDFELLRLFRDHESRSVEVMVDYRYRKTLEVVEEDLKQRRIGLFILHHREFLQRKMRRYLHSLHIPVITLSFEQLEKCGEIVTMLTPDKRLENISSPIFDIAIQLGLTITLYEDHSQEQNETVKRIVEHFENLAHIFSKRLLIKRAQTNIIKELMYQEHLFILYPFTEGIANANPFNLFYTDPLKLFFKLNRFHQIFIPQD
ncbi:MAG: potassium transporter TrkA [Epsilonproteobacteria bacterium]|nr:potassium transporter TrkA [Campylobacterota bacterium]NPA56237.1 potassium transporter TrkA [Campylobacterota bacterium]